MREHRYDGAPAFDSTKGGVQGFGGASGAGAGCSVERVLVHLEDVGGKSRDAKG